MPDSKEVSAVSGETRGFSKAYQSYLETLGALRAFASELDPAVQESARKAEALMREALEAMVKSLGFASLDEFAQEARATEKTKAEKVADF